MKTAHDHNHTTSKYYDSSIMQNSVPVRMFISCIISCMIGVIAMASLSLYLLAGVFLSIILCTGITTFLLSRDKISIDTACALPMLILCFVYTPISWFTFQGLLGCTPYLSILFLTIITLTYYNKIHKIMIFSYSLLLLGLIINWFSTWKDTAQTMQVFNILLAYLITAVLNVVLVSAVKNKNIRINRQILDLSEKDELTGLYNRRTIQKTLLALEGHYQKETRDYAAIIIDLNQFKKINDQYGHQTGDSVLAFVASCIRKSISAAEYAFRFGGDEFLIIFSCENENYAKCLCEKIKQAINNDQEYTFHVAISSGYALRSGSQNIDHLLEQADLHMYEEKKQI